MCLITFPKFKFVFLIFYTHDGAQPKVRSDVLGAIKASQLENFTVISSWI